MSYLVAIILGAVEGVTEFIPVSSSGHLIVVRELLGANFSGGLAFDAVLQLSASFAVLFYFRNDVVKIFFTFMKIVSNKTVERKDKVLFWSILVGTIPAIIFGIFLEDYMDTVFRNTDLVALTLILGSILFWFAQKVSKQNKTLSLGRGLAIGFFQCLALVPGVSRSGATISGGLISGLTQEEAVRFSFLLSLPILFGAGLRKLFEVRSELFTSEFGLSILLGSITAFLTAVLAIGFLIKYLKNHNLNIFIWYRVVLAILILLLI